VGRAGELGTLERALAAARAGRGAAILVAGEAGIGKTRLAAELIRRARDGGFATLLGRSIDLVGTELPYQPFAEALRSIGGRRPADTPAGSQLRVFEETLARLADHAAAAPVLLVLEDLHWADTSTLDLVVFLAHNLAERPVVLLATHRRDEPSSKGRMARLADGVRRSGSGLVLDLGPLPPEDLTALLAPAPDARLAPELADAIIARSAGNPFFAEELLAAGPSRTAELDLAGLCSWAAELASQTGASPRAAGLARRAIELTGDQDPAGAALLHVRLGVYQYANGSNDAGLAAFERAVELAPPPSAERAQALAAFGTGLHMAWRHRESLVVCEQALALARATGARAAELRALTELGSDLAYVGRGEEGLARLGQAVRLAGEIGDPMALQRVYSTLTDVLTMLGRPGESARVAAEGLAAVRRYGADATVLVANQVEALLAVGDWDEAERASVTALRTLSASYSYMALIIRADVEIGRGHFDVARAHLEAARATLREDRGLGVYDGYLAELALWERRWADAAQAIDDGLTQAQSQEAAQIRVQLCAKGLRAQAELAALARARRDEGALRARLDRARELLTAARRAAAEAASITPNAAGWHLLARAEHDRARGAARPQAWADAAAAWDRLERPPLAAYCRWRLAEALLAAGASRAEASVPLRGAHAVAARIGARPLAAELELLAQRARLDLAPPEASAPGTKRALEEALGLTPREADVLALMARGYTNREIATTLVISVKTAGVHVSHILRKLDAPNRLEAAAIAHRLAPGPGP